MSSSPEILPYKLDITDVEAKAARMQDLLEQIGKRRAAGQSTSDLEEALNREFDVLGRSVGATRESQSAIDKLISNKERLGSVVTLLGGQFSPLISQFASLAELARGGSKTTLAVAGILAVFAGLKSLIDTIGFGANDAQNSLDALAKAESMRQAAASERQSLIEMRKSAGVYGDIESAIAESHGLQAARDGEPGIPRDLANFGVTAGELLGTKDPETIRAIVAAQLATGEKFHFTRNPNADRQALQRMAKIGRDPKALAALRNYSLDMGLKTQHDLMSTAQSRDVTREFELQNIVREEQLNPKDVEYIRRVIARDGVGVDDTGNVSGLTPADWAQVFGIYGGQAQARMPEGASHYAPELIRYAQRVRTSEPPVSQQVTVNYIQTMTVGAGVDPFAALPQ